MKDNLRKEKSRRSLHVRLLALLMAVVMILSVVYVNHRNDKVKADTEVHIAPISAVDTSFLPDKISVVPGHNYVIYVPVKGVEFTLPEVPAFEKETEELTVYKKTSGDSVEYLAEKPEVKKPKKEKTSEKEEKKEEKKEEEKAEAEAEKAAEEAVEAEEESEVEVEAEAEETVETTETEEAAEPEKSEAQEAPAGDKIEAIKVTKVTKKSAKWVDDAATVRTDDKASLSISTTVEYQFDDSTIDIKGLASGTTESIEASIEVITYSLSNLRKIGTNDDKDLAFADDDSSNVDSEDVYYYGDITYKLSGEKELVTKSLAEINSLISADNGIEADGEYILAKEYKLPDSASRKDRDTLKLYSSTDKNADVKLTRNYYVVKSVSATYKSGTFTASDGVLVIPADGKVSPNEDIIVSIETDKDASLSISKPESGSAATEKSDRSTVNTFKLPKDIVKNNGVSPYYEVTVSDGDISEKIAVTVNYGDGTPVISSEAFDGEGITDKFYVNDNSHIISALIGTDDISGAVVKKAELYRTTKAGVINNSAEPILSESLQQKDSTLESVVFDLGSLGEDVLAEGDNYFKLRAESSYDLTNTSNELFDVFYDNTAPEATRVKVYQTDLYGFGGNTIFNNATKQCQVDGKITSRQSAFISIELNDGRDGSGIASVSFDPAGEVSFNEDRTKAEYELAPNTAYSNGGSREITMTVKDKAGNSEDYKITVNYFDEAITVDSEVVSSDEIKYTVNSEVPVKEAVVITDGDEKELKAVKSESNETEGFYVYEETYDAPAEADCEIQFVATTRSGVVGENYIVVEALDLMDPETDTTAPAPINDDDVSVDTSSQAGKTVESVDWYKDLILSIKVDTDNILRVDAEGTDKDSYNEFTEGKFTATGKESEAATGTTVKFFLVDKDGNKKDTPDFEKVYYVDKTAPATEMKIGGDDFSKVDNGVVSEDPEISFSATDAVSGADDAETKLTIEYDSTTISVTDISKSGSKLSELIGTDLVDGTKYKVTFDSKDKAGNQTDSKTATFTYDSSKPEVTIDIITAATRSEYPGIFNKDVTYKLTAKGTNLKEEGLEVTENGTAKTVTWTVTNEGDYEATAQVTVVKDGKYNIQLKATNEAGTSNSVSKAFIIDKKKPVLTAMVNGKVYDQTSGFFDADLSTSVQVEDDNQDDNDVIATVKHTSFDGTTKTEEKKGTGPFAFSAEGTYEITYKAVDKAGNENTKIIGFSIDKTKPAAKIDILTKSEKIDGYFKQDNVELALEVTDSTISSEGITVTDNNKKVKVSWTVKDGKATATYKSSSEGNHTVHIVAADQAGNEVTASKSFIIDRTKPKLTTKVNSLEYEENDEYFSQNVTTNVVVKDDNEDKDDVSATIYYDAFNGNYGEETKEGKGPFILKKQGKYKIVYKAVDKAGNVRTKTIGFFIDKTKPVGNMYIKTDKPAKFSKYKSSYINKVNKFKARKDQEAYSYGQFYKGNVTIEFNYFDYSIDSVTITDGDEEIIPEWSEKKGYGKGTATFTDEGHHVIKMVIEDKAGNKVSYKSGTKILEFDIDKTAPVVSATVNGSGSSDGAIVSTNTAGSVNVTVTDTNKDPDDITRIVSSTSAGSGSTKVSEGAQSFDAEADYDVQFIAVDKAGNSSSPASVKFRVDRTAPKLSITSNAKDDAANKEVEVTFSIQETFYNDMASSKIDVYKKVDGEGETHDRTIDFMPGSSNDSKTETFKDDGEYRLVFTARDKAGNEASESYSFILDGSKPVITLSGVKNYDKTDKSVALDVQVDETFYLTNKVSLEGTKTDIQGDTKAIDFENFPADSARVSNITKMFKDDGIYDVKVTSTDKAGNTDTKTIHFTIDTKAPVIDDLAAYDGTKVSTFVLDKPVDELVTDLTVCETKMYMDGALYDGSGALSDGTHVFKIEATDEMGHTSVKEVTFILDTMAPNIIVTGAENGTVLKNDTKVTVSVELDDDYLDTVSLNGQAVAISGNQAEINIDKHGRYTLKATASDGAGNKSSTEIKFSYGHRLLWFIIGGVAILIVILAALLLLRSKNSK